MKWNSKSITSFQRLGVIAILVSASVLTLAQQQPRKATSPYGSAIGTQAEIKRASGAITGFVFWQMSVLQPQSDCQGLTVKVITVNKSGMPLQLLATTNTFTAMGPVTDYSSQGTPKYMLCSYSLHNMPENVSLRTLLYGPPSKTFVIPAAFQIPGGNCSSGPPGTLSFMLTGGEMICGDGAFNINFKLNPPTMARSTVTGPLLNRPIEPKGTLLSGPQQELLSPQRTESAPANSGAVQGSGQSTPGQGGKQNQERASPSKPDQDASQPADHIR